jgi:hypothetical protein
MQSKAKKVERLRSFLKNKRNFAAVTGKVEDFKE